MKNFCESLRKHIIKIISYKKKNEDINKKCSKNHIKMQKYVIFLKKNLKINM